MHRAAVRIVALTSIAAAGVARAEPAPIATADEAPPAEVAPVAEAPRPWLYLDDPTTPGAMRVTAFSRGTFAGRGASPTRPFGADLAHPGGVFEAGGEVGLLPWLSVAASGYSATFSPSDNGSIGAMAGLRIAPLRSSTTHLVFSGGALRELSGAAGAWGRVSIAQDLGRARVGGTVHAEHVFADKRDGVDVMVMAGASYAVTGPLRLGVEYVAQDLEGAVNDEAEGGMRHFVGPTAGVELLQKQLTINAGPAVGLSHGSPPVVARLGFAYAF